MWSGSDICLSEGGAPKEELGGVEGHWEDVGPGSKIRPILALWLSCVLLGCRYEQPVYPGQGWGEAGWFQQKAVGMLGILAKVLENPQTFPEDLA